MSRHFGYKFFFWWFPLSTKAVSIYRPTGSRELILQAQSVFNCPPSYDDPCCPGKFCCNDGLNGCCNDNRVFYVPELSAYTVGDHECVCWPSRRSSGMCHFNLRMNLVNIVLLIQFWSHLWKPTGATGENGSTVLKVNMWWAWGWRLRAIRE